MVELTLDELKTFFPTKAVLYEVLDGSSYNFYLPHINSSAVTVSYLLELASRDCYFLTKEKHRKAPRIVDKSFNIDDLMKELIKIVKIPLGFETDKYPNRQWLLDCLYSENPNHPIFFKNSFTVYRSLPKE